MDFATIRRQFEQGFELGLQYATPEHKERLRRSLSEATQAVSSAAVVLNDVVSNLTESLNDLQAKVGAVAGDEVTLEQKYEYVYERLDAGSKDYYLKNKDSLTGDFAWVVEAAYEYYRSEEEGR